ncbi:uncharacterized protein LOC121854452 [Homarus americanus]|uniref:BZIP domain-containing protein n=1 Tax=Homarus americanus TaxID=6706 RepID=A0A8J5MLP6_HOMAM|nr:uncharacterized protein LOC121854452 [Homarus americanus]KAG7155840.1 hypothetical protein Hamer_G019250 [Homarus americanus]
MSDLLDGGWNTVDHVSPTSLSLQVSDNIPIPVGGGQDLQELDNNTLVTVLGLNPSPEECTNKLLDECLHYTDLLPSTPIAFSPQDVSTTVHPTTYITDPHHLDCVTYTQPVTLTLDDYQGLEFIENLVTVSQAPEAVTPQEPCVSTTSESSTPATPATLSPPSDSEGPTTRRRRRQQDITKVKAPRQRRPKKTKIYEREDPFEDPVAEKRRQNAINAKKNRDNKKKLLEDLDDKVAAVTRERDDLEQEVKQLRQREQELRQELMSRYGVTFPPVVPSPHNSFC